MFREKTDLSECCRKKRDRKKKNFIELYIYEFDYYFFFLLIYSFFLIFKKAIF